jgi:hypothetical protein
MKFRYLVGLLVALNFNNGFAADAEIAAGNYQGAYEAFTQRSAAGINAALQHNQDFNHNNDRDASRRSAAGLALRTAVIGLGFDDLKTVVETNHAFFKTSLGVSLLQGWALNKFDKPVTPYYIGYYFSFDKMFQGLATRVGTIADLGATAKTFFQSAFTRGLAAVEADRRGFYDHMIYLPYAIGQVRAAVPAIDGAGVAPLPSMEMVIANAKRSAMEARTEAANLVPAKAGRAVHLMDESEFGDAQGNWDADNFVGLQKYTIQTPKLCKAIDLATLEIFQSLPADTTIDAFTFMGRTVSAHMAAFRAAIEAADAEHVEAPVGVDVPLAPVVALGEATVTEHLALILAPGDDITEEKATKLQALLKGGHVDIPAVLNAAADEIGAANFALAETLAAQTANCRTIIDAIRLEEQKRAATRAAHEAEVRIVKDAFLELKALRGPQLTPVVFDANCVKAVTVARDLIRLEIMEARFAEKIKQANVGATPILDALAVYKAGDLAPKALPEVLKQKRGVVSEARAKASQATHDEISAENKAKAEMLRFARQLLSYVATKVELVA